MSKGKSTVAFLKENKTVLIVIAVALFLIELEIFAVAALKSGANYLLQVRDNKGNLVHETDGKNLSDFNKYYFEKTFGPIDEYEFELVKQEEPFPFRAWFVAAICIPIGIILLFGFAVKAYTALFHSDERSGGLREDSKAEYETRLEKIIAGISRFNIFIIGFLVFLAVISYWIIPNLVTYLGKVGVETLIRFKWVFLGLAVAALGLLLWIIYLKYRLAEKAIESQVEVDKYRMKLEYQQALNTGMQLEYHDTEKRPLVGWDDEEIIDQTPEEKKRYIAGHGRKLKCRS